MPVMAQAMRAAPVDERQLFLQLNDNHSCRSSPGGWAAAAIALRPCIAAWGWRPVASFFRSLALPARAVVAVLGGGVVGGSPPSFSGFGSDALAAEFEDG